MLSPTDIRDLRRALTEAGAFERHEARTWVELALLLAVFAGLVALHLTLPLWASLLLLPVTALTVTVAAMLGHEGGHRSLSRSRWRNELLLHIAFPLVGGLSALYWKDKHNVKHHGQPNVVDHDEDLELWPMASSRVAHERSGPVRRWFQRHLQGYLFWPLTSFLAFSMTASSFGYLIRRGRTRRGRDGAFWADVGCMIAHHVAWLLVPALIVGFWPAVGFYVAVWALVGVYLSAIFTPAHLGLPLYASHPDTWTLQIETTRNFAVPRWASWLFVGLDHQLEHHLFPRIPHGRMHVAEPIVRDFCEARGLPYRQIGFFAGLADVTRFMARAWDEQPVGAEPERAERPRLDASGDGAASDSDAAGALSPSAVAASLGRSPEPA